MKEKKKKKSKKKLGFVKSAISSRFDQNGYFTSQPTAVNVTTGILMWIS